MNVGRLYDRNDLRNREISITRISSTVPVLPEKGWKIRYPSFNRMLERNELRQSKITCILS